MNSISDLNSTNRFVSSETCCKKKPILARDKDSKKFLDYRISSPSSVLSDISSVFPINKVSEYNVDAAVVSKVEANRKTCESIDNTVPFYSRSFYFFDGLSASPVSPTLVQFPGGVDTRN